MDHNVRWPVNSRPSAVCSNESIHPTNLTKPRSLYYSTWGKYSGQYPTPLNYNATVNIEGDHEVKDGQPYENSTDPNEVDWDGPDDPYNPCN
jgi:hypothetical protein